MAYKIYGKPHMDESGWDDGNSKGKLRFHIVDVDEVIYDYKGYYPKWRELQEDEIDLASQYQCF